MKKSEIQQERWFTIAIIEGQNSKGKTIVEAIKIYNPITEEYHIESMNNILKRLESGQEIVGTRIRETKRYSEKRESYVYNKEAVLTIQYYRKKELAKLNGSGEVIVPGKGVVIGCMEKEGEIKFVVIDSQHNKKYLDRKEVLEGQYIGVYRGQIMRPSQMNIDLLRAN